MGKKMKSYLKIFLKTLFSMTMSYMINFCPIWLPGDQAMDCKTYQLPNVTQYYPSITLTA